MSKGQPGQPSGVRDQPADLILADITIEVLLDGDGHQRQPNNDAEVIDQALQVRELTGKAILLASCG